MQNRQHKLENLITGLVLIPGKGQCLVLESGQFGVSEGDQIYGKIPLFVRKTLELDSDSSESESVNIRNVSI